MFLRVCLDHSVNVSRFNSAFVRPSCCIEFVPPRSQLMSPEPF